MKSVVVLTAVIAFTTAIPAKSEIYADVFRKLAYPTSRIVGGEIAQKGQHPYQVSLQWGILGVSSHICGGSLISEDTVLTAGHCKAYSLGTYRVVLGLHNQGEESEDVQIIEVSDFRVHPGYPGGSVVASNDIAVLKLARPATLSDTVQIVALGSAEDAETIDTAVLSGWGLLSSWLPIPPTTLRRAELPRITLAECDSNLASLLGSSDPLDDTMICTGSNDGQKQSACSGDSGGPLVLKASGNQIGVVSWGISPCGTKGAPSVYTSVASHIDWINEQISS